MDADRGRDLSHDESKRRCGELKPGAHLVSVDTEEEFEFLIEKIRELVTSSGQEFANEQWWTAGKVRGSGWVWDKHGHPPGIYKTTENITVNYYNCNISQVSYVEIDWRVKSCKVADRHTKKARAGD